MIRVASHQKLFYGWIILAILFLTGTTIWGMRFSFGVFFKSLETEFDLSRAATSMIFSAYVILSSVFATVTGWAIDRFPPKRIILLMGILTGLSLVLTSRTRAVWQVFLTYSLLLSMGTGMVYVTIVSVTSRWFYRKRGLALGIAGSGSGLGMLLISPLATYLITGYDWRTAYLVMGIMTWVITIPLAGLVKKDPYEVGSLPDGLRAKQLVEPSTKNWQKAPWSLELTLKQVVCKRSFWLLFFHEVFCANSQFFILAHLVPHATDIGISVGDAALLLGLIGGLGIWGRILTGGASDRLGRKGAVITCSLAMALALVWLMQSTQLWMFYTFAIVYGFCFGGRTSTVSALISDTFGLHTIGKTTGLLEAGWGIGAAVGPALGGLIFDMTGSYRAAFLMATVTMSISVLLLVPVKCECTG